MKIYLKRAAILNVIILIGFIVLFFMHMNKVSMIISMGIQTANLILNIVLAALILIFLVGNFLVYRISRRTIERERHIKRARKEARREEDELKKEQNTNSPRYVRSELEKLIPVRPRLRLELGEGLDQITSIERKEEKFSEILRRNRETTSLNEVMNTIHETKDSICLNLSKIVNRAIIWDPNEVEAKKEIYDVSKGFIYGYLKLNDRLLDKCNILLNDALVFIEGRSGNSNSEIGLDVMIDTMKTLHNTNSEIKNADSSENEMNAIENISFGLKKEIDKKNSEDLDPENIYKKINDMHKGGSEFEN